MKKYSIILSIFNLLIAITLNAQDYSGYTACAEQDSLALVAFFYATDGPNWITQQYEGDEYPIDRLGDNVKAYYEEGEHYPPHDVFHYPNAGRGKWLVGPVKDWFGILLEKRPIGNTSDSIWRVVHLRMTDDRRDAGDIGLKGAIPREVGLLTALEWFKINGNIGVGDKEFPKEIYHSTITRIDIESTKASGDLPDEFRNCTKLEFLNLRKNYLDSIPSLDFMDPEVLNATFAVNGQTMWFYQNQFTYATLEPSVEYLMSISPNIEYEMHEQNNVGREREVILPKGGSLTLTSDGMAGKNGTYTWYMNGFNIYATTPELTVKTTGDYAVKMDNKYIASNGVSDPDRYNTAYSKLIHVVSAPTAPLCKTINTSYSGKILVLEFSKPMAVPSASQASEFSVTDAGNTIAVTNIQRTGRLNNKLELTLASPISKATEVSVSYTKGSIVCSNGGALETFTLLAENYTREKPILKKAITELSGESIILSFDRYIDGETFNTSDFKVSGSAGNSIAEIVLKPGPLDKHISKEIQLIMTTPLSDLDKLSISYTQGSLCALYGGMLDSFENFKVENVVVATRVNFTLKVIDGSEKLENIVIGGNLSIKPFKLYDDGTNGDEKANDHIWTKDISKAPGDYTWEVNTRTFVYDTIYNGDNKSNIVNEDKSIDSLISSNTQLKLSLDMAKVTGDLVYEYSNNTILFILDYRDYISASSGETGTPYLMGINGDWTNGIEMKKQEGDSKIQYVASVGKQNPNDVLEFLFRIGDEWETESPGVRSHTIQGNDTIVSVFGITTSITDMMAENNIIIYPNPANKTLHIKLANQYFIDEITLYNLAGKRLKKEFNTPSSIKVEDLDTGIYIVEVVYENGKTERAKFLKLK